MKTYFKKLIDYWTKLKSAYFRKWTNNNDFLIPIRPKTVFFSTKSTSFAYKSWYVKRMGMEG